MEQHKIAIVGGTGNEGKGLGYRWAKHGHTILIGSRTIEKAEAAVAEIKSKLTESSSVSARENLQACREADVVVMTVPYAAHRATLESIREAVTGKIFIDVTAPLVPPKVSKVQMPEAGSALKEAKLILGENTKVACAFQNISHELLVKDDPIECDVLVCGEDKETRQMVIQLVEDAGLVGYDAGPIDNAVVVEGLTSVLIGLNIKHKIHSSGIKITGIPNNQEKR